MSDDLRLEQDLLVDRVKAIEERMTAFDELAEIMQRDRHLHTKTSNLIADISKRLEFTRRLEAFFGPMLDGKNPPFDDQAIASKDFVTEAVTRLAAAHRSEWKDAVNFAKALAGSKIGKADTGGNGATMPWWKDAVRRINWMWQREHERAHRPSRVKSLLHAITGYSNTNGKEP